jgi:thiamine pyrophosphate-dependent acetolactate synthase large subunit-like protein
VTGTVAQAIGAALAAGGVTTVFGVAGSGNFHVTNALIGAGARFVPARHEGGAVVMADAYARITGQLGVLSVHQGPGLTNAMTGITEAAKSRTPLLILAAEATSPLSNFHIDQPALARSVGARSVRVGSAAAAAADTARAVSLAASGQTVLLNLPLDVQEQLLPRGDDSFGVGPQCVSGGHPRTPVPPDARPAASDPTGRARVSGGAFGVNVTPAAQPAAAAPESVAALADALAAADRPVFIAGRGARRAGQDLQELAERPGALLATSAVSRGLFRGHPWNLDVSGGFATPAAARLITGADLIVGWGCALNMWTLRHGTLVGPDATVVQVDTDAGALGAHQHADLGVVGDAGATARAALAELERRGGPPGPGYRTPEVAALLSQQGRWRDVPYQPAAEPGRIDPRTLTIALDDLLPGERTVVVDSGNFMGYPSMFLDVPDADGFVFTQAYQSVGLGLAGAVGAAVARPDRLTVAACGDGGLLMGASELETVVRLGLDLAVVAYDDEAYGAEVHHFGPGGEPLDLVRFPPADLAAIGRGFGFEAVTVRSESDLPSVGDWARGPRNRPLLIDAKVTQGVPSWWLEEAFRGH